MLQCFNWSRWRARGSKTYYLGISKVFLERYEWCLLEQKMTVGIKIFTEVPATQFYSDCDSCVGGVSGWKQVLNSDSDRCAQPEHSLGFTLGSDVLSVPSLVGMNKGYGAKPPRHLPARLAAPPRKNVAAETRAKVMKPPHGIFVIKTLLPLLSPRKSFLGRCCKSFWRAPCELAPYPLEWRWSVPTGWHANDNSLLHVSSNSCGDSISSSGQCHIRIFTIGGHSISTAYDKASVMNAIHNSD
jgi:hypothetical protein